MPAEWVDVSAARPWLDSPLGGKDRLVSRPVQRGWGTSGNYGCQAGRSVGRTSDLWEEVDEEESLEEQPGEGWAQRWGQSTQADDFYKQSAKGKSCLCQTESETGCRRRQTAAQEGFVLQICRGGEDSQNKAATTHSIRPPAPEGWSGQRREERKSPPIP